MEHVVDLVWNGKMLFTTDLGGHKIVIDAPAESGGDNKGPGPKRLLLTALAGCTGMDVVSLCEKMRAGLEAFHIVVLAPLADEHPKRYTKINLQFVCKGSNIDRDKVTKAIKMSEEKYCGVWATLRNGVDISYDVVFE